MYAFLGRVFISELDTNAVAALTDPGIALEMERYCPGFLDYINAAPWDEDRIESLAVEYCRLFVLPQKSGLSPQASHWVRQQSIDFSQLELIIQKYQRASTDTVGLEHRVPYDHLGLILDFIGSLYASTDQDTRKLAPQVVKLYLSPWITEFVAKLSAAQPSPVYVAAGNVLEDLVNRSG